MPPPAAAPAVGERQRGGEIRHDLNRLLKLSGPVVLSRLAIMTMGLTDTIVVGRYSAEQLGFHALGWAPTTVILTVMIGLLTGVQVMTARVIGEGRRHLAGAVLRRGMVYGLWLSIACTAFLVAAGPPFMHVIGLDPVLADGLFVHTERPAPDTFWEADLTVPNVDCQGCVVQEIQWMAEHPGVAAGGFSYHHCATVNVTRNPDLETDSAWEAFLRG